MIRRIKVGVKSPVTGTGIVVPEATGDGVNVTLGVALGEALGLLVGVIVGVAVGVTVGVTVGVAVAPDRDAVKAGASPACTTKSRVKNLVIPLVSIQEIVMVCGPRSRSVGTE
jgi:hypothetical protein